MERKRSRLVKYLAARLGGMKMRLKNAFCHSHPQARTRAAMKSAFQIQLIQKRLSFKIFKIERAGDDV